MKDNNRKYVFDGQDVSPRLYHIVRNLGINNIEQLKALPDQTLMRQPNFGRVTLNEVYTITGRCPRLVTGTELMRVRNRFNSCVKEILEIQKIINGLMLK